MILAGTTLSLVALCTVVAGVQAQEAEETTGRTITAEALLDGETIVLDGILDESAWKRAKPGTDFIQQDPTYGGTPTERTEVRFAFDRDNLYMGVYNFDSEPDKMLGNTMKRDEYLRADDRFMWVMDTFLDRQTGYFFEMNPSGLMSDSLMAPGGGNRNWDGIWDAKVLKSDLGWTIELALPFRTLNFDPNGTAWGVNFQRTIRRKNEENLWTGHMRNQGLRRLSNTGLLLLDLSEVSQGFGLDVKPYLSASGFEAPGVKVPLPLATTTNAGVDLFYNVTPGLRANLTVNTDFAQTEVDQRLVNLTRFPLFFPEKRDFFLDGATFFNFYLGRNNREPNAASVQPFFSRRIGLHTDGSPQKINYGTKLTGQVGKQDVGFLHVRTDEAGSAPAEDFTVMRIKRRLFTQSYVGMFYSRRHANTAGSISLETAGVDFRLATSQFQKSKNLEFNGFLLWNTNPVGTVDNNLAYGVRLDYPNDRWEARVSFTEVQENHNPAIGFTRRRGFRGYGPRLMFAPRPRQHRWIRQLTFGVDADVRTDVSNRLLTRKLNIMLLDVNLHSQERFSLEVIPTYERLERTFEISPGIELPAGTHYDFVRYKATFNTANRRIFAFQGELEAGTFFSGTRKQVGVRVGFRPRPGVTVNFDNEWNRISLNEGRFDTFLHRLVVDTQFSPWIYLVNNVQFDSVSELMGWQSRLRWIVTPGNDLFVIYTHNWLDDNQFDRFVTQDRRGAAKFVFTHRF
ncbi:MAG: carbohydrate binding family 9 domain-containing protein [Acidobacteriota bacterium]|nr:carbohydrate binding family 9 domain-containing protein [Acidobacteriota bacterium]